MRTTFALLIATVLSSMGAEGLPRVVSAAGAITEAVYALGSQDRLVAVDTSSVYPTEALELPQVGYARQLAAEGILSVHPTLLLITDDAGPPNVLAQVEKAGVRIVRLTNGHTPDAAEQRIRVIGEELGKPTEAKALIASMHEGDPPHLKIRWRIEIWGKVDGAADFTRPFPIEVVSKLAPVGDGMSTILETVANCRDPAGSLAKDPRS